MIRIRETANRLLLALLLASALALVAGQLLGQPILFSYVETGSMSPTLAAGDGFVAVPAVVAGPIETGDVVVYRSEHTNDGGLTTHRVVSETDDGFVTKGDANPFTDQADGEPPVKHPQIVAVAWQPGGTTLVLPAFGSVVTGMQDFVQSVQRQLAILFGTPSLLGTQGLAYLLFIAATVGYGVETWRGDGSGRARSRSRERSTGIDVRVAVGLVAALVVLAATSAMVLPAGTQQYDVVSSDVDGPSGGVIERGESERVPYRVSNGGFVPVVVYLEPVTEGVTAEPGEVRVPGRSTATATVTLSAPSEIGHVRYFLVEHRYLAVLPRSHVRALYAIHPWAPIAVIDALVGGTFYLSGLALVGKRRLRRRTRDGPSRLARIYSIFT